MFARLVRGAAATAAAVLLSGAFAGTALGAPRPLTMDVLIGDSCVSGFAKAGTVIKVTIKDGGGTVIGRDAMIADSDGSWFGCESLFADALGAGMRIKVLDYDTHQTLDYTIPRITLSVNRVTNVVSGKAPAGMKLAIEAADFSAPLFGQDPYDEIAHVTVGGSGSYSHNFSNNGVDLMAGAQLEVRTRAAGGAITTRRDLVVPGVFVNIGQASFGGYMQPFQHLGIRLKAGGVRVATGDGVGDFSGQFSSQFIDADGEAYRVAGGEKMIAPALGISWRVPKIAGTVDKATDKVSGTCFANKPFVVLAGDFGLANGTTGATGKFTVDMSDQIDLRRGDEVLIACFTQAGDVVEQDIVVH